MICYSRFWDTMRRTGESTYTLIKHHRISSSTSDKLRKNKSLTTTTINDLCRILNCRVEDILELTPGEHQKAAEEQLEVFSQGYEMEMTM